MLIVIHITVALLYTSNGQGINTNNVSLSRIHWLVYSWKYSIYGSDIYNNSNSMTFNFSDSLVTE